jgi:hypothetical protein
MGHKIEKARVATVSALMAAVFLIGAQVFSQEIPPPAIAPPRPLAPGEQIVKPPAITVQHIAHPAAPAERSKDLGGLSKGLLEELKLAFDVAVDLLSGNEAHLLSGNKADLLSKNKTALLSGNSPKVLSENQTPLLSGNRVSILSNIKLDIRISITNSGNNGAAAQAAKPGK